MTMRPGPPEPTDLEMIEGARSVLGLLAGRWSVEVVFLLAGGTRRYSEIFYEVGEVSKKTLTQTLRGLARDGLVVRHAYPEVPPRVEYALTDLGWSITGVLMDMHGWSVVHRAEVERARG